MYDYFKAIHIIFVVTWFSGLFYLPRLFIYHVEASKYDHNTKEALQTQFAIMQKRLWYGITWPSCVLAIIFGLAMIHHWLPLKDNMWLMTKLAFVFGLFLYHLSLGYIYRKIKSNDLKYTSTQLRFWNEVSTIFLISIVFLVVLKSILGMVQGFIGLMLLMFLLCFAIMSYKRVREKNEK